jgi:hypothetical protein
MRSSVGETVVLFNRQTQSCLRSTRTIARTVGSGQARLRSLKARKGGRQGGQGRVSSRYTDNNLINRHSVAGRTRTVARTVGSDQGL